MQLVYRGRKYRSKNSIALKLVREQKHQLNKVLVYKQRKEIIKSSRFPVVKYVKQLFSKDNKFITSPRRFWHKKRTEHIEKCWKRSEVIILNSCWKMTLDKESKKNQNSAPIVLKYRGVTYYK